jgi:glutathione S-transferase
LITFEPMVDSQCARMLLDYYGLHWRERDHMLVAGSLAALLRTGKVPLPVVYGKGFRIASPRPMAEHFDARVPEERRLIPAPGPLREEVEADWKLFNGGMGAWTAHFAYYHLMPERRLMTPVFRAPLRGLERALVGPLYPVTNFVLKMGLKLSAERAEAALASIRNAFDATDRRIADGRPYLTGERITLGDFGLASATAALVLPRGYKATMPRLEDMPPALKAVIEELRQRPTAAFVERFYDERLRAVRLSAG